MAYLYKTGSDRMLKDLIKRIEDLEKGLMEVKSSYKSLSKEISEMKIKRRGIREEEKKALEEFEKAVNYIPKNPLEELDKSNMILENFESLRVYFESYIDDFNAYRDDCNLYPTFYDALSNLNDHPDDKRYLKDMVRVSKLLIKYLKTRMEFE